MTFIALCGTRTPHFTTIAAFVSGLGPDIAHVLAAVLAVCDQQGLIRCQRSLVGSIRRSLTDGDRGPTERVLCKYTQVPAGDEQAKFRTCRGQVVRPSGGRGGSRVGLSRAPSSRSRWSYQTIVEGAKVKRINERKSPCQRSPEQIEFGGSTSSSRHIGSSDQLR